MKSGALVYLSREIDNVPHSRRDLIFAIICVGETAFAMLHGVRFLSAFWRSFVVTLALFFLSYLGSLIVIRGKRFKALYSIAKALYSIAFVLYFLMLIRRHKSFS